MPAEQVLVTGGAGFIGSHAAKLLARAHVLAYTHLKAGGPSLAVNLGTGRGTSITEILDCDRPLHRPQCTCRDARTPRRRPAGSLCGSVVCR